MNPQVRWVLSRQAVLAVALSVIAWAIGGIHGGLSVLLGGSVAVVANAAYAWRAMRAVSGSDPVSLFRAQAAGEALKFTLTVVFFALVFIGYKKVAALPLFIGYASTFAIYWMALLKK